MPKRLHVLLTRDLDFDCLDINPVHDHFLHGPLHDDVYDPEHQAEKRLRIERIAAQCLKGRLPFIASARLRGPFENGWKNPWARPAHTEKGMIAKQRGAPSQLPSLETARRLDYTPFLPGTVEVHMTQADAPLSIQEQDQDQGQDHSAATEFFSLDDADPPPTYDTSENNPFWLRRHPSDVDFAQSKTGHSGPSGSSPTRIRDGNRPVDESGGIQLALPKNPLEPTHSSPIPIALHEPDRHWKSSASVSRALTSPVKVNPAVKSLKAPAKNKRSTPSSTARKELAITPQPTLTTPAAATAQVPATSHHRTLQYARDNVGSERRIRHNESTPIVPATDPRTYPPPPPPSFTPVNKSRGSQVDTFASSTIHDQDASSSILQGHQAATNLALHAVTKAYELAGKTPPGTLTKSKKGKKRTTRTSGPDLVTSPALNASTGFMYRKVGEEAQKSRGAQKPRPRPMTFDSSPIAIDAPKSACAIAEVPQQGLTPVEENTPVRRSVYDVPDSPQESSYVRRQSDFSTQAAMARAHKEFQEGTGTMPSIMSETPRASLPSPDDTPQSNPEPTVAFTPFSAFNAELDKQHQQESITEQESPFNTQALFANVSPLVFSTIKKPMHPRAPLGSSLRFAVFPSSDHSRHVEAEERDSGIRSPTVSDGVPVKEGNPRRSLGTASWERGTQESVQSRLRQPNLTRQHVELPQLDFGNSLGEIEANGDLDLTDRFLHNLNELTWREDDISLHKIDR